MSERAPMRCAEVEPYLSPFVDDELAEPLREQVAAHIATCASCARKVERYRETKRLLGVLPSTAPSPEVFERVMAVIPMRYAEPAARESLSGEAQESSLRRRLSSLDQPAFDDRRVARLPDRRTLVTRLAPLVAALLIITLGLVTYGRFTSIFGHPVATSTPVVGHADEATAAKVDRLKSQLGFQPATPKAFPSEATLLDAHVGSSTLGSYLDITWGFANAGYQIHFREAQTSAVTGYNLAQPDADLSWQIVGQQPWRPLLRTDGPATIAVGQLSVHRSIAMDVNVTRSNEASVGALAVLRRLALSIDLPYRPVSITSVNATQLTGMALHYTLVGRDASNHIVWTADSYLNPTNNSQRIDVAINGKPLYTDIISPGALPSTGSVIRLDYARHTYQQASQAELGLTSWVNSLTAAERLFLTAGSYADTNQLWYIGQPKNPVSGQTVDDLELVTAPSPTHFYVSTRSSQLVTVTVDATSTTQPGGPSARDPFATPLACESYMSLTYVASNKVPGTGFSNTIPSGYVSGAVPQTVSC